MKKLIVTLLAVLMLSITAFAGPTIGLGIIPVTGTFATFTAGWDFGDINAEVYKEDLSTYLGVWGLGIIWTPEVEGWDSFNYRAGIMLNLKLTVVTTGYAPATLSYGSFDILVGVSKTWGAFQLYGDLNLTPGVPFAAYPRLGVNFLFDGLLPAVQSGSL